MLNYKSTSTLIKENLKLIKDENYKAIDSTLYKQMMSCLKARYMSQYRYAEQIYGEIKYVTYASS